MAVGDFGFLQQQYQLHLLQDHFQYRQQVRLYAPIPAAMYLAPSAPGQTVSPNYAAARPENQPGPQKAHSQRGSDQQTVAASQRQSASARGATIITGIFTPYCGMDSIFPPLQQGEEAEGAPTPAGL
ncbi:hypothetical protein I316_02201 [Kwoniella heveanensis BCC8398]|uniref:Uncharacterized protein n=1 Tax=Kwoniella heveanensis BCC8398 TaxID=1296120 RepID=A0A1B9GZ79_9TREE|nr:hypothetical protein I316_02201 [Kwoniella heveanensis BCC8398]